jgi:NADPH:quinone reductase
MKAAWYERQGTVQDVLTIGEMEDPQPQSGGVRIRVAVSGMDPDDGKKPPTSFRVEMLYPRVVPHRDRARVVDVVGEGVSPEWVMQRALALWSADVPSC